MQQKPEVETLNGGKGGSDKESWFSPLPPPSAVSTLQQLSIHFTSEKSLSGFKWLVFIVVVPQDLNYISIKCGKIKVIDCSGWLISL